MLSYVVYVSQIIRAKLFIIKVRSYTYFRDAFHDYTH